MKLTNKILNEAEFLTEQELLEMPNLTSKSTGIDNVVLWVGPPPKSHGLRIKVSSVLMIRYREV